MSEIIGQKIRKAREEAGLTLEQAAEATHIRLRFLTALEEGRWEEIASPVQARGFLRLYAGYLGIELASLAPASNQDQIEGQSVDPTGMPALVKDGENDGAASEPVGEPRFKNPDEVLPPELTEELPVEVKGSVQIYAEIGQLLRNQRENLGITLVDVERYAHLRQRYVEALEEGRMEDLPSPVQGRGLLGSYAGFLEMDSEALLLRFADALQLGRLERMQQESNGRRQGARPPIKHQAGWKRFLTPDLVIGSTIILMLFGFAVWGTSQIVGMRTINVQATVPGISKVLLVTPSVTAQTQLPISAAGNFEKVSPSPTESGETTVEPAAAEATGTPAAGAAVAADAPLNINITARQTAWMKVTIGKKVVFNGRVVPGNAYPYSATERIEVLTGNAAALQVVFNQNDLGTMGLADQVGALIFTTKGIQTPTAMFSPTPTFTPQATVTQVPTSTPTAANLRPTPLQ